jgi:hypothetical protein
MSALPLQLRRLQRPRWAVACLFAALSPPLEREAWLWEIYGLVYAARGGEA